MKIKELLAHNYENGYELWIDKAGFHFDTIKEAYLYYLEHFASKEDFEYYKECSGKDLKEIADNPLLIGMVFENVFPEKHHLYKVIKAKDGRILRSKI